MSKKNPRKYKKWNTFRYFWASTILRHVIPIILGSGMSSESIYCIYPRYTPNTNTMRCATSRRNAWITRIGDIKSIYLYMPTLGDPKKNLQIYPLRPSIHPPQSVFPYANPVNPSRITKLWETHSSTARGTAVLYCLVNSGIHPESLPHSNLSFQAGKNKIAPSRSEGHPSGFPTFWVINPGSIRTTCHPNWTG